MATLNYQRGLWLLEARALLEAHDLSEKAQQMAQDWHRGTKKISGETWWKQLTCWHLPYHAIPIIIYPYLWVELYIRIVSICQYTYDVQRMFWTSSQPRTQNLLRACCEARSEKPCHVKHQIAWWTQHLGRRMFSSLVGNGYTARGEWQLPGGGSLMSRLWLDV